MALVACSPDGSGRTPIAGVFGGDGGVPPTGPGGGPGGGTPGGGGGGGDNTGGGGGPITPTGPAYVFDFTNVGAVNGTNTVTGNVSSWGGVVRTISPNAASDVLDFIAVGNFRGTNGGIDPNGTARTFTTTVALSGSIRVVMHVLRVHADNATVTVPLAYGSENVNVTFVTSTLSNNTTTLAVEHTFAAGSGTLGITNWPWAGSNGAVAPGRLALQRIEIWELP